MQTEVAVVEQVENFYVNLLCWPISWENIADKGKNLDEICDEEMDLTPGIEVTWASDDQTFMALFEWVELSLQVEIASLVIVNSGSNFKYDFNLVVMFVHSDFFMFMHFVLS